jgi:dsDNA-binding SOS-regulon protein
MQWDKIMEAAKRLEDLLRRADVDFNEAQKAIGYYLFKGCDDTAMERYLKEMAENPPDKGTSVGYKKSAAWGKFHPL